MTFLDMQYYLQHSPLIWHILIIMFFYTKWNKIILVQQLWEDFDWGWNLWSTIDQSIKLNAAATMFDLGTLVILIFIACIVFVTWIFITVCLLAHAIVFWPTPTMNCDQMNYNLTLALDAQMPSVIFRCSTWNTKIVFSHILVIFQRLLILHLSQNCFKGRPGESWSLYKMEWLILSRVLVKD